MKMFLAILTLVSMTAPAFAAESECDRVALSIAKTNLDTRSLAYGGYTDALITDSPLTKWTTRDGSAVYALTGNVGRQAYSVRVQMNSNCGIESVSIKSKQIAPNQ